MRIVMIGAGVVGLGTAMLLAGDGHRVIVLERDPAPPPAEPPEAWQQWQRPGVNQFRLPHSFLAGFREVLDAELPDVAKALQAAGALRLNAIRDVLPAARTGGWQDGDERYEWLTGRGRWWKACWPRRPGRPRGWRCAATSRSSAWSPERRRCPASPM